MKREKQHTPAVSVMMCAYNAESYIREAIDSTLAQTFTDFELVIVDDGSTDRTPDIIRGYADPRIRFLQGQHDYIRSLNAGMKACRGEFVARMDADDRMMPERLAEQVKVMRKHHDIAVCFSWANTFGLAEGKHGYGAKGRVQNAFFWLLTGNYLTHPTAMFRKSFFREHRIRYRKYPYAEDYKLWTDISRLGGQFYVIPKPLIMYRISRSQVSHTHHEEQNATRLLIQQEVIETLLQRLNPPERQLLTRLYQQTLRLNQAGLIQGDEIVVLMYKLFRRVKNFV